MESWRVRDPDRGQHLTDTTDQEERMTDQPLPVDEPQPVPVEMPAKYLNRQQVIQHVADVAQIDIGERMATVQPQTPRHPARVTADRLADHVEKYADQLTRRELDAIDRTVTALEAVAAGQR